ncbi:hypothetical protein EVAR_93752_1 [Eumeta japonica]|uniref:Uncharacterized protein n=1 Tax=Eumeta variegata TaxID=151549 RepID=A0A4C2AHK4_EUMVA|nr:hypothetical protein EVAR_93752_1 [Eumeta japonica]
MAKDKYNFICALQCAFHAMQLRRERVRPASFNAHAAPASPRAGAATATGPGPPTPDDPYLCEKDCRARPTRRAASPHRRLLHVRVDRFCDSNTDCPDNSDEWSICGTVVTRSDRLLLQMT